MKFTRYTLIVLIFVFGFGLLFSVSRKSCKDCVCPSMIDKYCEEICTNAFSLDPEDYLYCMSGCKMSDVCREYMDCDKCDKLYKLNKFNEPSESYCMITGCNGEVCLDKPVVTRCEWICEYGCFKYAKCDNVDGLCQWVPQDGYDECIRNCEIN